MAMPTMLGRSQLGDGDIRRRSELSDNDRTAAGNDARRS